MLLIIILISLISQASFSDVFEALEISNTKASAITAINGTIASNGIDKNPRTYVLLGKQLWYIINMMSWQIVEKIKLRSREDCCGRQSGHFRIDFIEKWDGKTVVNGSKCNDYTEETVTNAEYTLFCLMPLKISKYVILYRIPKLSYPFSFSEITILGFKYKINLNFTLGCYRNSEIIFKEKFLNPDHCTSSCSIKNYEFAAFDGKQCMCTNQIGVKTNISDCDNFYEGKYIMAKLPYHFFYKTLYCKPINCNHFCKNKKYFIFGKCGKEGCDPGYKGESCDVRDCSVKNGNCGESKCIENNFLNFSLSYCVCNKGFITLLNNTCVDLDECKVGVANCPANFTCINSIGSFKCLEPIKNEINERIDEKEKKDSFFFFLFILLLILILILLIILITKRKNTWKITEVSEDEMEPEVERVSSRVIDSKKNRRPKVQYRGFLS